jgi:hypothetical protein
MQELQTINVHMRIITEDNIDQIENMSFSKNIQRLTHTENLDMKGTFDQIQKDITKIMRQTKENKFVIEDTDEVPSIQPITPEGPPPSSPEYQPITPEGPPPSSPEYQPITPEERPGTPTYNINEAAPSMYGSISSSDYGSPPAPPSAPYPENSSPSYHPITPEEDEAKTYKGGEKVTYKKDSIPGRPWVVSRLTNPNLYKIESEGPNSEIEVVTPLDIKPFEKQMVLPDYGQSSQQIPTINIAPVFNLPVNTTSDPVMTSAEETHMKIPTQEIIPTVATNNSSSSSSDSASEEKPSANVDFNNIIIKKL